MGHILNAIASMPKGIFELNNISGWSSFSNPTTLGREFKEAVLNGKVPNVKWVRTKSNNHEEYEKF